MPELPEILQLSRQMDERLVGKIIREVDILQPKSLNTSPEEFIRAVSGAEIRRVDYHGKWIRTETTRGWILINLGMGGEILLVDQEHLPEKRRLVFHFTDESKISINFWWFGYVHHAALDGLRAHEMTARLGPNIIDLPPTDFQRLLNGQRKRIKTFLLDQSKLAGIGNFYIHDILFLAGIHPLRSIESLNVNEVNRIYDAIHSVLQTSIDKHTAFYEVDLYGQKGGYTTDDILIGYKENQPCPRCQTLIQKLQTGSTTSFICPSCQPLKEDKL